MNGQTLEFVLMNEMNSGVYIATSELYFPHKENEYENHTFVYNSYFTQEEYPNIHGGITDNRINSNYRGLEKKDTLTNSAFCNTLNVYFGGNTRIHEVLRVWVMTTPLGVQCGN